MSAHKRIRRRIGRKQRFDRARWIAVGLIAAVITTWELVQIDESMHYLTSLAFVFGAEVNAQLEGVRG